MLDFFNALNTVENTDIANDSDASPEHIADVIELVGYASIKTNSCLKGCKWSPDGSILMVVSFQTIYLYNIPHSFWKNDYTFIELLCVKIIKTTDSLFDFCWLSTMDSWKQETCLFAVTCRDSPIHLMSASDSSIINTYKAYNQTDELQTSCGLAFTFDGTKLIAGYNKMIRFFDVENQFSSYEEISTHNKLFASKGQHGMISCFAQCATVPNLFAAGSYTNSIGIYARPDNNMVTLLHGSMGGITHLSFSHDGSKLFSGGRKDDFITCWDLRNMGKVYDSYPRPVNTNQRIYFDIYPSPNFIYETNDFKTNFLVSGQMNGEITFWNLRDGKSQNLHSSSQNDSDTDSKTASHQYVAHKDCVNGISIHPCLPLIATSSGQRHIKCHALQKQTTKDTNENSDDELSDNEYLSNLCSNSPYIMPDETFFSVKIWKISHEHLFKQCAKI